MALAAARWLPPALACSFLLLPVGPSTAIPSCFQLKAVLPSPHEALGQADPRALSPLLPSTPPGDGSCGSVPHCLCSGAALGLLLPVLCCLLSQGCPWSHTCRASSPLAWGRWTPWG